MSFLPKTLIITLSSSLFVALVINPVLCALFMNLDQEDESDRSKNDLTRQVGYWPGPSRAAAAGRAV
ncbi:MAG: hypothetical protein U5J63_17935 [Fodinibius sp.]|nr:hypothetical protein [Fodinibius sp.]